MSENIKEIKRIIPIQSDDSEFDNFFGLEFGMDITDAVFKCLCYGMNLHLPCRRKNNNKYITLGFKCTNLYFYNYEVSEFYLSFIDKKYEGYCLDASMIILKKKSELDEEFVFELKKLISKFDLQEKKNKNIFIDKETKRKFILSSNTENVILSFEEKGSNFYFDTPILFAYWFVCYSGEFFPKSTVFAFAEYLELREKNISDEQRYSQIAFIMGLSKCLSNSEFDKFKDFWNVKTRQNLLPELAEKVGNVFKSISTESIDEKTVCEEIKNVLNNKKNEITSENAKKRAAKKAEKDKANEENIRIKKALYASLAEM